MNEPFNFNVKAAPFYPSHTNEENENEKNKNENENNINNELKEEEECLEELEKQVEDIEEKINNIKLKEDDNNNNNIDIENIDEDIERIEKPKKLAEVDQRQHMNIIFIGHVDAGKSTTCGNILYTLGYVDERTIEKYEREAKEKNRESWFLAFIMDINEEERQKGKTVEVGRAHFETENRRFTILDAPGHKNFIPNMISGAAQADIGVLIISARKGEFETGFERGGQTREHTLLARTLGINQLVIAINKMDDCTCNWSEERYNEIQKRITPFLKSCGYNLNKDIHFIPISGLTGQNLSEHVSDPKSKCYEPKANWYDINKPTLYNILNNLPTPPWDENGPLRIPLLEGYKDNGIIAIGKIESGTIYSNNMICTLMPNKVKVKVMNIFLEDEEVAYAKPGENIRVRLIGVEEDEISKGFVLCDSINICSVVNEFIGRVAIVELLEHKPIITAGYFCIFHAHTACEEIQFIDMLEAIDKKTQKKKTNPKFIKSDCIVTARFLLSNAVCVETYNDLPQLGRFTLRDQGKTIAIGKIMELIK